MKPPPSASHPLDNPIWHSLSTAHASLARSEGFAARYPAAIAPFAAVAAEDTASGVALDRLLEPGELLYLLAVKPPLGEHFSVERKSDVLQMVCSGQPPLADAEGVTEMDERHREDMLALTALVFPGFFRARTLEMGRYIGLYHDGVLAAMAGERMRIDGWQEISAVCTHPDHQGQGHAHRLIALLCQASLQRGLRPFLHCYPDNRRARDIYERLGFADRTLLPLWSVIRAKP